MTSSHDHISSQQRETWDRFSAGWKSWDDLVTTWMAPFGTAMIRHASLRDTFDVLDVATGTGEPGLTAATLVPRGHVTLTDLSERMLVVAAEKAAERGMSNVETRVSNAEQLPFADSTFDAVLCRFGFMFFPDVAVAARELARVTRPGGRVSVAVWATPPENPWAMTIMSAIGRHVTLPTPPKDAPGLFRCAAPGFIAAVFGRAGLCDIVEELVTGDLVHESAENYWEFMTDVAAPVVAGLALADTTVRDSIRREVLAQAQQHLQHGQIHLRSTARIVSGTRAAV